MLAVIIVIVAVVVIVGLLACWYAIFRGIFYNTDEFKALPVSMPKGGYFAEVGPYVFSLVEDIQQTPHEDVWITSHDGLKLYGRYYHARDGAPLHIQFHGYKGFAERDFAGCRACEWEQGYNTLLIDERAHGKSDGHVIRFGIEECRDVVSWARYAESRFGAEAPIILSGASMGAASVLMASDLDLPASVRGIIADSPYDSPKDIICESIRRHKLPVGITWKITSAAARVFGRLNLNSKSAIESVRHAKVPVLIFHGTADHIVPHGMSERIADACASNVTREVVEGAAHCGSYLVEPERYVKAIGDFTDRVCR